MALKAVASWPISSPNLTCARELKTFRPTALSLEDGPRHTPENPLLARQPLDPEPSGVLVARIGGLEVGREKVAEGVGQDVAPPVQDEDVAHILAACPGLKNEVPQGDKVLKENEICSPRRHV